MTVFESSLPPAPIGGPVHDQARRLHAVALETQIKGMLEVRTEAWTLPHTLMEVAGAIRARAQKMTNEPVDVTYGALLMQIASVVDAAAHGARRLGPQFDALHDAEIRRLLLPRTNEQKWDTGANKP